MTHVLVLGATGRIARQAVPMLAANGTILTLFARSAARVEAPVGARVIEGDVLDPQALDAAMAGQDVVYANLGGEIVDQAEAVVAAMDRAGVSRLVFVLALGIHDELPEGFREWNQRMSGGALADYRRAAEVIEASDLDYTLLRPAWLTDDEEIDYETTERGQTFRGTEVSRRSVAALVTDIVADPSLHSRGSVGVDKPGTDGDKPAFY